MRSIKNMIDRIKKYFILKWTKQYITDFDEVLPYLNAEQTIHIQDIIEDLKICEKVYLSYYSYFNI